MTIYLISYSTPGFRLSQFFLNVTGFIFGCNKIISYTEKDLIKSEFYKKNKSILCQKRGGGYWLWKYYFINELIKKIDVGDIIVYADSGIFFRKPLTKLVNILKSNSNGVLLFYNDFRNRQWTKRDCFVKLNCDTEEYYNSPQIGAQFQLFQKNEFSVQFISEVLEYSCFDIITDSPNILGKPNLREFIENRHDQSITSLLAHKNGIVLYPDPSQFKTKDVTYRFPIETKLDKPLYKSIVYVHRFSGFNFFNKR